MGVTERLNAVLGDRYAIEQEIGSGGMATVYRARDLKHNRPVALKVLRSELAAVLGPDRFLSEINVTANLQHPHLLPLFDSGEADGLLFYVMPFVEGESLRDRLQREHQLPVDEAIRIAVAVASALEYAHQHGVIHRDLKPENILLQANQPMVSDFGIALAISNAGGARVTQTGLSLGTPQYMSPEQATGDRAIDARSDVYSLAAVLYEMLVGDPPHLAGTTQAIIAKVLTERPTSVRAYRETVPEHVDAAILCALAKLPADRFASAGAFAEALAGTRMVSGVAHTSGRRAPGHPVPKPLIRYAPWGIAAVLAVLLGVLVPGPRTRPDGATSMFVIALGDSVEFRSVTGVSVALSRDGTQLAFVGEVNRTPGILLRRLDQLEARLVRGTEGGITPSFSPDGNWLLFLQDNKLRKVPVVGGAAITVADSAANGSHWGASDLILEHLEGSIWSVPAEGGTRQMIAAPDSQRGHLRYSWPHLLPNQSHALITLYKRSTDLKDAELGVVRLRDGRVTELGVPGTNPRYLPSGHIVFGRSGGGIFAASFSIRSFKLGAVVPIAENVAMGSGGKVDMAFSDNGTFVYASGASTARQLLVVNRAGGARALTEQQADYSLPRISPDGRRAAVMISTTSGPDIWTYDFASGTLTRLTTTAANFQPEWSPDGRRIAYVSGDSAPPRVRWQPWDGSGTAELVARSERGIGEFVFGPPGKFAVYRLNRTARGSHDLALAPIDSPQASQPLLATAAEERAPAISPDGQLLAYMSNESGDYEVYVRPLPGPGARVRVSTSGGAEPVWSPNNRELFYRAHGAVMAASILRTPELAVGGRTELFPDTYVIAGSAANFDVFPNGTDLLMVQSAAGQARLVATVNWLQELRRRTR